MKFIEELKKYDQLLNQFIDSEQIVSEAFKQIEALRLGNQESKNLEIRSITFVKENSRVSIQTTGINKSE